LKPTLNVLDRTEIERIHQAALDLLQDVGVKIASKPAEELLREAGQQEDASTGAMRISPELVEQCLSTVPPQVLLAGRDESRDVVLGTGKVHTCLDGQGMYTLDPGSGQRRSAELADLVAATRLSDALDSVDYLWPNVVPTDVPQTVRTYVESAVGFIHTSRHVQHEIKEPNEVPYLLEMFDIMLGDRRRHAERPIFSITCCPVSPLKHESEMTTASLELARNDVPVVVMPMPLAGATAPVTLAGTLAMLLAEFLSGVALYQLARPGLPMILGIGATILDMRTGLYSAGAPELSLLNIAMTQIGKDIGVPVMAQGLVTDAKAPGAQASYEKATNGLSAFMAGSDVINGLGLLDSSQMLSFEQMVIDDEIASMLRRIERGFEIDTEHLMLDLIADVGHAGHFVGQRRTLEYLKKGEHFQPKISFRSAYQVWQDSGYDEVAAARERAGQLLKEHEVLPLASEEEKAIEELIARVDPEVRCDLRASCLGR
jgi:trimethylamine--corrinoid protein Co-methyltransferase